MTEKICPGQLHRGEAKSHVLTRELCLNNNCLTLANRRCCASHVKVEALLDICADVDNNLVKLHGETRVGVELAYAVLTNSGVRTQLALWKVWRCQSAARLLLLCFVSRIGLLCKLAVDNFHSLLLRELFLQGISRFHALHRGVRSTVCNISAMEIDLTCVNDTFLHLRIITLLPERSLTADVLRDNV